MRKASASKGFLLCFFWNLLLNFEWAVIALVLFLLHFWPGIPLWISLIGIGIWLVMALLLACLVAWGSSCSNEPTPVMENKNPYSAKNADFLNPPNTSDTVRHRSQPVNEELIAASEGTENQLDLTLTGNLNDEEE